MPMPASSRRDMRSLIAIMKKSLHHCISCTSDESILDNDVG